MPLSNAEKQRHFKAKLKETGNNPPSGICCEQFIGFPFFSGSCREGLEWSTKFHQSHQTTNNFKTALKTHRFFLQIPWRLGLLLILLLFFNIYAAPLFSTFVACAPLENIQRGTLLLEQAPRALSWIRLNSGQNCKLRAALL